MLSPSDVRSVVTKYVKSHELISTEDKRYELSYLSGPNLHSWRFCCCERAGVGEKEAAFPLKISSRSATTEPPATQAKMDRVFSSSNRECVPFFTFFLVFK